MTPPSRTTSTGSLPSGWYTDPDPQSLHQQRWWDGAQWTDQVRPALTAASGERIGAAKAVRALVFAIVGLVLFVPLSVAALVMGARARREGKRTGRPVDGRMTAAFVVGIVGVCLWGMVGIIAAVGGSSTSTPSPQRAATGSSSVTTTPAEPASGPAEAKATESKPAARQEQPVAKKQPEMTSGQENALESARSYIDMSGFSKNGLIKQLSSSAGDGFSKADATFAANNVGADWKAEAVESAQSYLDMGGFSEQALTEQLSSSAGDGFTREQALYAVNKVY